VSKTPRRIVLVLAAGIGLVVLAGESVLHADKPDEPKAKQELFLVGPFALGDLFQSTQDEELLDHIPKAGGPDRKDLLQALNGCKAYLVERRTLDPSGKWLLGSADNEFPKLVTEGKLFVELKDQKGEEFKLYVAQVRVLPGSFSTQNRWAGPDKPPQRSFKVVVDLKTNPLNDLERGILEKSLGLTFATPRIAYDVQGKVR
jgi:hypothetical protein